MEIISIQDIYKNFNLRIDFLKQKYVELYNKIPEYLCRAPGRVNIIGEHIDYCGYGVLPMAIDQDIFMLVTVNKESKMICLKNTNSNYVDFSCDINSYKIDKTNPKWFNYFLCGYCGITENMNKSPEFGIDILVDGQVPCNAGLSSSSALVCCSAMVAMVANGLNLTRMELAEICQRCERYIGTEGGGMDQTICFMAEQGKAKYVQFEPLRTDSVCVPSGGVFVVANSLVEMNKSATDYFNIRVAECRLATQLMAHQLGLDWKQFRKLSQIQKHFNWSFNECVLNVDTFLRKEAYSKKDISNMLGCTVQQLEDESLSERSKKCDAFMLHKRARHVFTEAERVVQFKNLCNQSNDSDLNNFQTDQSDGIHKNISELKLLGKLMNESHESCSHMYECSCVELDNLVQHSRASGALGSRLTGAGWGGCCVSLVLEQHLEEFISNMKRYYLLNMNTAKDVLPTALFSTFPSRGAFICQL